MRLLILFSTCLYSHIILSADYTDVFDSDRTTGKLLMEDESKILENQVQKSTDENISLIEKILVEKEKEILTL